MQETKPWYKSKGVVGGLVAFLAILSNWAGLDLDEGTLTEVSTLILGLVGAGVGIYGRVVAKDKIE